MVSILIVCLALSASVIVVAFAWTRIRGTSIAASMPPGTSQRRVALSADHSRFRSRSISRLFSRSSSRCMRAARATC